MPATLLGLTAIVLGAPAPAGAQSASCTLQVDGRSVESASTPDDAIEVDVDRPTLITAQGPPGPLRVNLRFGPLERTVLEDETDGRLFAETVVLAEELDDLGVGIYEVHIETPGCSADVWVHVVGRSPTSTTLGLAGAAGVLGGGLLVVLALLRTLAGRGGGWLGPIGAVPLGIGANVLAQQYGVTPVTTQSLIAFSAVPSAGLAVAQRVVSFATRSISTTGPAAPPTAAPAAPAAPVTPPPVPTAAAPATTAPEVDAEPRHLQAEVTELDDRRGAVTVTTALRPGARCQIEVWIGPKGMDGLAVSDVFPVGSLPKADEHELTVVLTEPVCAPTPLVAPIVLPRNGPSGRARFELTVPADAPLLTARIAVLFANRVLQTAMLRARISVDPDPEDRIELLGESMLRVDLSDLGSRDVFDAALVVDRTPDGAAAVTTVRGGAAQLLSLEGTEELVERIGERLSALAADPEAPVDINAEGTVSLLRYLAVQGALLRDKLLEAQVADHGVLAQQRLQILSVHPEAYLPFEFIYDKPPPSKTATLCPNAVQALGSGSCSEACAPNDTSPSEVICPVGFWCLNRVIERHAAVPERLQELHGRADIVLDTEPTAARRNLDVTSSAVFAFSDRVDRRQPPPSQAVIDALTALTGGKTWVAKTWAEWRALVQDHAPGLLVLLSHTIEDDDLEQPGLEIASGEQLLAAYLDESYVRAQGDTSPPVVLLLGCETATTGLGFERFMTTFQQKGAGIVVGTLATVLGYQAAPVAASIATAIGSHANGTSGFGDLLLATRRQLLADGMILALTLTAYGDADWRLTTTNGGS